MKTLKNIFSFSLLVFGLFLMVPSTTDAVWINYDAIEPYKVKQPITVTITATPKNTKVAVGGTTSTELNWQTSKDGLLPDSCVASSAAWSGTKTFDSFGKGGPEVKSGLGIGTHSYKITCSKVDYADASDTAVFVVTEDDPTSTSGNLNVVACKIAKNASTCSSPSNLSWSISNPLPNVTTSITRDKGTPSSFSPSPVSGGSSTVTLDWGSTLFSLIHNGTTLKTYPGVASCEDGLRWDGAICTDAPPVTSPTISYFSPFSCVPAGTAPKFTWASQNTTSCEITRTNPIPAGPEMVGVSSQASGGTFDQSSGLYYRQSSLPVIGGISGYRLTCTNGTSTVVSPPVSVNACSQDFYLSASPVVRSFVNGINPGTGKDGKIATYIISTHPLSGFSSDVDFTVDLPSNVMHAEFSRPTVKDLGSSYETSLLTIGIDDADFPAPNTSTVYSPIVVRGVGGGLTREVIITADATGKKIMKYLEPKN